MYKRKKKGNKTYKQPYKSIDIYINKPYSAIMKSKINFEWDEEKDNKNKEKHNVSFALAQLAFLDEKRIILEDQSHSEEEQRYYCLGKVAEGILTVRFTYRNNKIRIIGAGYWRKGKNIYEKENDIQ